LEFKNLFPFTINYTPTDKATPSGLFAVENSSPPTRLYKYASKSNGSSSNILRLVEPTITSLSSKHVYLATIQMNVYIFVGKLSSPFEKTKVKIIAEGIIRGERCGKGNVIILEESNLPPLVKKNESTDLSSSSSSASYVPMDETHSTSISNSNSNSNSNSSANIGINHVEVDRAMEGHWKTFWEGLGGRKEISMEDVQDEYEEIATKPGNLYR